MEIIAGLPTQLCQMNVCESRAGAGKVPPVTFAKATVQLCLLVTLREQRLCQAAHTKYSCCRLRRSGAGGREEEGKGRESSAAICHRYQRILLLQQLLDLFLTA